jgi:tRNA pseudouridine synthase 10
MEIIEKALMLLEHPLCDHCLGRQFAQLLCGYTNDERGRIIRSFVAFNIDRTEVPKLELSNFSSFKFHNLDFTHEPKKSCAVCNDFFISINKWADRALTKSKNYEFRTFLVGTKLSTYLATKEEWLWELHGIDFVEPIKAEINREVGKLIEKKTNVAANLKNPDINFILNIEKNEVALEVNPIFFYGEYQKLKRGIPQTKWPSGKYKTSVEQIIAKPFMKITRGKEHKLHGLGREDIDARCLAWRPFVLEILKPKKRSIVLKPLKSGPVRTRKLKFSNIEEVRKIKESKAQKTYRALVECDGIEKKELEKLQQLVGVIDQNTPKRVMHRRADKLRKRKVISLNAKYKNKKLFYLTVRTESGTYIKELISGDDGRTSPSVSLILGKKCVCRELDVINIHV